MTTPCTITVTKNGPYVVSGEVPLVPLRIETNAEGESVEWGQGEPRTVGGKCALCRCGESANKPFCDGTHARIGFDGAETASHLTVMEQAVVLDGPTMQLADAEVLCAFARFCDPNGRIWNQVRDSDDPETRANLVRQAGDCPAGRLVAIDKATGEAVEPALPPSIGIVQDPSRQCSGPLWVRGGIQLIGADGRSYELRNRMALCRCGRSENKPFCNGAHAAEPVFQDGLAD
ncbi:MAG TPA: CDGSH iron-sulfur domain-containing protein [Armatimonadota bacterium]|jgi:CDGSH-type Zn-finger protein